MNIGTTKQNLISKETASLHDYLDEKRTQVEQALRQTLALPSIPSSLSEAAEYAVLGSGKRIRSILSLATLEALGGSAKQGIIPACALELVHSYSLIHDDLPCMDDDDFRRGKPSLHKAFTEAHAVLTGDFLLTHAFEIISSAENLSDTQKVNLTRALAQGAGGSGMIGGQISDIESEGILLSFESLQQMHRNKTGALITTSVVFGAVIGNASTEHTNILKQFAEEIGLAFQIVDDILDVTKGLKNKDPNYSSDHKNKKSTYVSLLGIDQAKQNAEALLISAKCSLELLPFCTERLIHLADWVVNRQV